LYFDIQPTPCASVVLAYNPDLKFGALRKFWVKSIKTDNKYSDKIEEFNYYHEFNQEYNLFIKSLAKSNYLNVEIVNLNFEINRLKDYFNNKEKDLLMETLQYFESEIEKK